MDIDRVLIFLEHQGFSDEEIDDFIEHFGIKGMRWGVRSNPVGSSSDTMGQNIGDGLQIAKSLLRQIGKKRMSDIPTRTELQYGKHAFNLVKLVEKLAAASA